LQGECHPSSSFSVWNRSRNLRRQLTAFLRQRSVHSPGQIRYGPQTLDPAPASCVSRKALRCGHARRQRQRRICRLSLGDLLYLWSVCERPGLSQSQPLPRRREGSKRIAERQDASADRRSPAPKASTRATARRDWTSMKAVHRLCNFPSFQIHGLTIALRVEPSLKLRNLLGWRLDAEPQP
jgi:hypothetical protein